MALVYLGGMFIITFILVMELFWVCYKLITGKGPGLTKLEWKIVFASGLFIIIVIAIVLLGHNSRISWVYRSPLFYLPFRFAIVYLIGIPIFIAVRNNVLISDQTAKKKAILYGFIITVLITLMLLRLPKLNILALIIYFGAFQLMFGYFPAIYHNPIQIILPFAIAVGVHLYFYKTKSFNTIKPWDFYKQVPATIIGIAVLLMLISTPII
jgi:hypothetical protein